jgi:actin-related protein
VRLDAIRLRNIFERVWRQHLKPAVSQTLRGAVVQLRGQEISVILLSGGSSNIGWLRELIKNDVQELSNSQVLELRENFQEVVAKGLAIECARKFFKDTHTGDFHAVTYNQLCLALRADEGELEILKFRPDEPALAEGLDNGVLLHSASSLGDMLNVPLSWKFKMSKPPRRQLEYFFMASSVDPDDLKSLHNVDRRIFTPPSTNFNSMQ